MRIDDRGDHRDHDDGEDGGDGERISAFFGRRKGRPLRSEQAAQMADLLPELSVDLTVPADLTTLFAGKASEIRLEIGFGGGEHLLHRASERPDIGFIGVEPFVNGMAKAVAAIGRRGLANIRLSQADGAEVLAWLPAASLTRISLLYPDPWPKKRHWKRRFVRPETLDLMARALKVGGHFHFASDIDTYVDWTLEHVRRHPAFRWTASGPSDWRTPFEGWPGTRYEAKALREGRRGNYLSFERVSATS